MLAVAAILPACDPNINNGNVSFMSTIRVSLGVSGQEANGTSSSPSISGDGRYVAFSSRASNLHPDDADAISDVYVRDVVVGQTILVSRATGPAGAKGNADSVNPQISPNGQFVVFETLANNLDPADPGTDVFRDIYIRDLVNNTTTLVSRANGLAGLKFLQDSKTPTLSDDGNKVGFIQAGNNIVLRDLPSGINTVLNTASPCFHPSMAGDGLRVTYTVFAGGPTTVPEQVYADEPPYGVVPQLALVSKSVIPGPNNGGNDHSRNTRYSGDGNLVVFESRASDLLPIGTDNNLAFDIYIWDRVSATLSRASLTNTGDQATKDSVQPSVSEDGRYVAFASDATNLVSGDTNKSRDVFVRDRVLGTTVRASVRTFGGEAGDDSSNPSISRDGRFVAFESIATDMVGGDTNTVTDIFVRGPLH